MGRADRGITLSISAICAVGQCLLMNQLQRAQPYLSGTEN